VGAQVGHGGDHAVADELGPLGDRTFEGLGRKAIAAGRIDVAASPRADSASTITRCTYLVCSTWARARVSRSEKTPYLSNSAMFFSAAKRLTAEGVSRRLY
jgi:hypothetical protein